MLRILLGLTVVLGVQKQVVRAQPPLLDSLEKACRCWLESAPSTRLQGWPHTSFALKPTLVWQGKPTGLPITLWNAVQQAPPQRAIQLTLQHWYQVPWPGRKHLVMHFSQRMPQQPCSRYLIKLLN